MSKYHQIVTSNSASVAKYVNTLQKPNPTSHKGQNGKLLIIGGSSLFHAASLWAAMIASKIVDMVHYYSTEENEKIFLNLKSKWVDGIVIKNKDIDHYVQEDNSILIGPGMLRGNSKEAHYTKNVTTRLLLHYPHKQFILDAGSLQMIKIKILHRMKQKPILTPHKEEYKKLFLSDLNNLPITTIANLVRTSAYQNNCIIHLKMINDIITDGDRVFIVKGGNAGLTKGGSGDVLSGLISALSTKNDPLLSCIVSSILLKRSADTLFQKRGTWYSITELIQQIPLEFKELYN